DKSAALAMSGVLGVFTGADVKAEGFGAIPHDPLPKTKFDMKLNAPGGGAAFVGPHYLLPADKVRHTGEAVAMVVAETETQAQDAAEAVRVEYETLPFVLTQEDAMAQGAPAVFDEVPGNVFIDTFFGDESATSKAFMQADHVVKMDFHVPRVTAAAMEPRAAFAQFDKKSGQYELVVGGGGAVRQRSEIASVLKLDPAKLRVMTYDVGGNFGAKNRVYVEYGLVVWAAMRLGRAVKYCSTRNESLISDYQGRDLVMRVELALRKDGKFLGFRADNISNVGAFCVSLSPLGKGAGLVTGSYDIPAATLRARAVFTNTTPTQAYRSSGRPEVNFGIERLIDTAARELGFDRIKLRRKNLVRARQMPYTNAVGATYDSGEYEKQLDLAMKIADWEGFAARKRLSVKRGKLLGLGLAHYVESSIGTPREHTDIRVLAEGRVSVKIGTQPSGQGHETSFAQVMADLIGVPFETIDVVMGDTKLIRAGGGTHSGRSLRHAATIMAQGAQSLVEKARSIAAHVLGCKLDEIEWDNHRFVLPGTNHSFDMFELAREAAQRKLPGELADGLFITADHEMHDPVFPNGCAVCEVEIDPATGAVDVVRYAAVDDVGRCINPLIVHGQTHGGIVQGLGQAMCELCALDPASGQPLAGSFMDYGMPRADAMPSFRTEIAEVLSPTNPLGIKAGGEGGTTPALSVYVNAVIDALQAYDVRDIKMPVTSFAIWKTIQESQRAKAKA
ncbi:MAG: xanthine dehydrogenase family protein, partial [Alphaproteobacteria bacterium]|nr:xanthine dehydrogenase family protein [Alphaproteobacteria bacterium]